MLQILSQTLSHLNPGTQLTESNTAGIRIPDMSDIQVMKVCPIIEWSVNRMVVWVPDKKSGIQILFNLGSEYWTSTSPLTEWWTMLEKLLSQK